MNTFKKFIITATALIALSIPSFAISVTSTISSTTASYASKDLSLNKNESLTWTITGTATGTVVIQRSGNRESWRSLGTAQSATGVISASGSLFSDEDETYYRMLVTTITAGSFVCALADVNDKVVEIKNNKGVPVIKVYDESITITGTAPSSVGGSFTAGGVVTSGGNLTIPSGAEEIHGTSSVGISTAITSGNSQGKIRYVYLKGTQAAVEGSLLVSTTPASTNNGATVAVSNIGVDVTSWVGIASAAASTGTVVGMYTDGFVLALTTGVVTAGDTLVNATNALGRGHLKADTTPTTGADVGVAQSAKTATASQLILIRMR